MSKALFALPFLAFALVAAVKLGLFNQVPW